MTIPTSWTDNGLTWDTANPLWTLQELNLAMIEAIKEKDSATSRTVPSLLSATYNPIRPNRDYVNAIHSEVTALIPLFVNHTDHGGDWDGVIMPRASGGGPAIPNWTDATILTAIGDPARIIPSNLNVLSPWYFQTKKILDLLKWRKSMAPHGWGNVQAVYGNYNWAYLSGNDGDPNYYNPVGYWYYGCWGHAIVSRVVGPTTNFWLQRAVPFFPLSPTAIFSTTDIYIWAFSHNEGDVYVDIIGSGNPGVMKRVEILTESNSANRVGTLIEPSQIPWTGTFIYINGYTMAVLKFDGANGFKFR